MHGSSGLQSSRVLLRAWHEACRRTHQLPKCSIAQHCSVPTLKHPAGLPKTIDVLLCQWEYEDEYDDSFDAYDGGGAADGMADAEGAISGWPQLRF